eukprot:9578505-Alexandrium_andersonii.AAC.1
MIYGPWIDSRRLTRASVQRMSLPRSFSATPIFENAGHGVPTAWMLATRATQRRPRLLHHRAFLIALPLRKHGPRISRALAG